MDKQTKQWLDATKRWIKTHKNSIEFCDLAIKHAKENIKLNERAIQLETEEKKLKIIQLKEVENNIKKYL